MKFSAKHSVEALESRIAPARLIQVGAPNLANNNNDVDYNDSYAKVPGTGGTQNDDAQILIDQAIFLDTEFDQANPQLSVAIQQDVVAMAGKVGIGTPGVRDTFYVRLSAGDRMEIFTSGGPSFSNFLQVSKGEIVAFFADINGDNEVNDFELMGLSVGKGASFVTASAGIRGSIVTNLDDAGQVQMDSLISSKHVLNNIVVGNGSVEGSIIAGGNISNLDLAAGVGSIVNGTAANGKAYDFYPGIPGGDGVLSVTAAPGVAGPTITNVQALRIGMDTNLVNGVLDPQNAQIVAGGGGAGAKGGSVSRINILQDVDGLEIYAGAGGNNGGKGGAGGTVTQVYLNGNDDLIRDNIIISGGAGGTSTQSTGGAGGAVSSIFVSYRLVGGKPIETGSLLNDTVSIAGGLGGSGKTGGAGGGVSKVDIRVGTADGLVAENEISIVGGAGGASILSGGKGGAGGSLKDIAARNQNLGGTVDFADILLQAGNGGAGLIGSVGGVGGSVSNATILGWEVAVVGGNGGEGKTGGKAGGLTKLVLEENGDILTYGLRLDAGIGGNGLAGSGGAGGTITGVSVPDSDLARLEINTGASANGGSGTGGKGGAGGLVSKVEIKDNDVNFGAIQTLDAFTLRTGAGGNGTKGGGAGGSLTLFSLEGSHINTEIFTGDGGDVLAGGVGKGGASGALNNVSVVVTGYVGGVPVTAQVLAGTGGSGAGNGGAGGAGGEARTVTLFTQGTSSIQAGHGGDGQTAGAFKGGASGKGGSVVISQITALEGNAEMRAGDAGAGGFKAGIGGSVTGLNADFRAGVFARGSITIEAGDGSHGGAGGNLKFLGYGSAVIAFSPTPFGNITLNAGNGSAEGKVAGVGGSIFDLSGPLASEDPIDPTLVFTTAIKAGNGGGSALKSAAGGSIQDVNILGGGFDGAFLTVQAGDAGDAGAGNGAKGGDVKSFTVSAVDPGSIIRSVAAGYGGDGSKGGQGGSIVDVYVGNMDIGDRHDQPFGIATMGGLFAGLGGNGTVTDGKNGSVTKIIARGIGAIVAGRELVPQQAELVDEIYLTGTNTLVRSTEGLFVGAGSFRLEFDRSVTATEQTAGTEASAETQRLVLGALQDSSVEMTISFGVGANSTTVTLPGNADAAAIQAALNNLDTVKATGPANTGAVTVTPTADGFDITFNTEGNEADLFVVNATAQTDVLPSDATATDVQDALNALPTIQALGAGNVGGTVIVEGESGAFVVEYGQTGNVIGTVEGVEIFDAFREELIKGSITVVTADLLVPGASPVFVEEVRSGDIDLFVRELSPGSPSTPERQGFTVDAVINDGEVDVQFTFSADFILEEFTVGSLTTREEQTLDLTAIKGDPEATFTLTFTQGTTTSTTAPLKWLATAPDPRTATQSSIVAALAALPSVQLAGGLDQIAPVVINATTDVMTVKFRNPGVRSEMTGVVTSKSVLIDQTATAGDSTAAAAAFQTELNKLASVKFTAIDRTSGTVTVIPNFVNSYFVDFAEAGDQRPLIVKGLSPEIQRIETDVLLADPAATFDMSFSRTYEGVERIKGSGSGGSGVSERQEITLGAVISDANPLTTYRLFFGNRVSGEIRGDMSAGQVKTIIDSTMGLPSTVNVAFLAGGVLQITFVGKGDQQGIFTAEAVSRTGNIPAVADEVTIMNALNALPTIKGVGAVAESVTVTDDNGDFRVQFSTTGEKAPIVAALTSNEQQVIDTRSLDGELTGGFRVGLGGSFSLELPYGATAQDVADALNSVTEVADQGGVSVVEIDTGLYAVTYLQKGDKPTLEAQLEIDEIQRMDIEGTKPVVLTVTAEVVATETISGGGGNLEVQVLNLGALANSGLAQMVIEYALAGEVLSTITLPANASATDIQAALVPLFGPEILVEKDNSLITVTFPSTENQPSLLVARVSESTAPLPGDSSAATLEGALNALSTVQFTGYDGVGGTVDVTVDAIGSSFDVRFNSGGDQVMIGATQEEALNVFVNKEGVSTVAEVQSFSTKPKGAPVSAVYAVANLIGFYSDATELDANVFHFLQGGVEKTIAQANFVVGQDQPIDGLVLAKNMNQARISVTPEAYGIGEGPNYIFFDWDNTI